MKKTYWTMGLLAVSIAAGAITVSHAAQGKHGPRAKMADIFTEFDANSDGQVTLAEMEQNKKARFAAADQNGDAKLSSDEAVAYISAEIAKRMADRVAGYIEKHDSDADGMLSYDEVDIWQKQDRMFDRIDADHDGVVSKQEFTLAAEHKLRRGRRNR